MPVKRKGKGKLSRQRTRSQSSPRTRGRPRLSKKSRVRRRRTLNGGYETYIDHNTGLVVSGTDSQNRDDTIQRMNTLINEFKKGKTDPNINKAIYNIIRSYINRVYITYLNFTTLIEEPDKTEDEYEKLYKSLIDIRWPAFRETINTKSVFRANKLLHLYTPPT
jgi:hypothetical protein